MVIDTDIIIRFVTKDDDQKAKKFRQWLKSGHKAVLTDVTVAEIYWVLRSFYHFPKEKILFCLEALITVKNIDCHKSLLLATTALLKKYSISFIDAYLTVYASKNDDAKVLSFDKGFDKIKLIKRVEP